MSENFPVWSLTVGGPEVDPCWDSLFDWIVWFLLSAKVEKLKEFHSKQGVANIEILVICPYKLYFYKTCRGLQLSEQPIPLLNHVLVDPC